MRYFQIYTPLSFGEVEPFAYHTMCFTKILQYPHRTARSPAGTARSPAGTTSEVCAKNAIDKVANAFDRADIGGRMYFLDIEAKNKSQ